MAVSLADFKTFIGAGPGTDKDDALLSALEAATDQLDRKLRGVVGYSEAEYDQVLKVVAGNIYKARDNITGNAQTADYSAGQPVMGPRDPFQPVWPMLRSMGVLPF